MEHSPGEPLPPISFAFIPQSPCWALAHGNGMTQSLLHVPCDRASWVTEGHPRRSGHISFSLNIHSSLGSLADHEANRLPRTPLSHSTPSSVSLLLAMVLRGGQGGGQPGALQAFESQQVGLGSEPEWPGRGGGGLKNHDNN